MKTFEKISKKELIRELQWHLEQDKIIQGNYGEDSLGTNEFKGCMMGCAVNSILRAKGVRLNNSSHQQQAEYLGLPEWFVYLYESIFEGLSVEYSKRWVIDCFNAIPKTETKNIDKLESLIKIWIIESTNNNHDNAEVKKAVEQVKQAILANDKDMLSVAESAAGSLAWSVVESTERLAAWAAESAAGSTAESTANAAGSAAISVERLVERLSEKSEFYKDLADYVLKLLRGIEND